VLGNIYVIQIAHDPMTVIRRVQDLCVILDGGVNRKIRSIKRIERDDVSWVKGVVPKLGLGRKPELTFLRDIAQQSADVMSLSSKERKEFKFSKDRAQALLALRDFRLTSLQAEKLFEIRDATELHRDVGGISVRNLVNGSYEARLDLHEDGSQMQV
jgi:hypothetical protein